jgi:DhnA family fructose-bisphosphate aldolase class Ia
MADPEPRHRLILAADHRARGVVTVARYVDYLAALRAALPSCDGILASAQPLADLVCEGAVTAEHETYLSINRTGLAGAPWEVDDRLVASVERAAADGCTGVKIMTKIDVGDPRTSGALELLGRVLEDARGQGLEVLVESVPWRDGRMGHELDDIVRAAVIAHDIGAPLLKVPVPAALPGAPLRDAVERIVASVGVPVLFLGGPVLGELDPGPDVFEEARAVMAGGAGGLAVGRAVLLHPDPAKAAAALAAIVHPS